MSKVRLHTSTGINHIDEILAGIVGLYETVFPGRVRGYYLFGSYANRSAVWLSDIDMGVLFKGSFIDEAEESKALELRQYCSLISPIRLDIGVAGEEQVPAEHVQLKLASMLVFGEDIRETLPMPAVDAYAGYVSGWPNSFVSLLHDSNPVVFPLEYPDPQGEFFGYDRKRIPAWYPASAEGGTKELVACVCWAATFILAWKAGVFVGTKADAVTAYKDCIDDEFAPLVDVVYHTCSQRWAYAIPEQQHERRMLRDLCSNVLAFENRYLSVYRDFLVAQLQSGLVEKQGLAVKRLGETIFVDEEVTRSLLALADHPDSGLRQAVQQTLQTIQHLTTRQH